MDDTTGLYLDDLTVGDVFHSDPYVLDEAALIAFAQEFDPQPFHTDPEAAKSTIFGGLAASGWHTAAITMRLLVTSGLPLAEGIIGAGGELAWPAPTRPGDTLQVTASLNAITPSRSRPDRASVAFTVETTNQRGDVVQRFSPTLIVHRKPST